MISSILSMRKVLSGFNRGRTDISAYGAIGILLLGLVVFLWVGWQIITSSAINTEKTAIQQPKSPSPFPSIGMEKELVGLYGSAMSSSGKSVNERFLIREPLDDDILLLAAPRAKLRESLVGILMSSDPEKNIAIIDNAGKQASYGLGDHIAGKFTILKILQDRVVINENGFYAALILDE